MHRISLLLLCLLVLIVPWEGRMVIPGLTSLARVLGLLVLIAGILKVLFSGRLRRPPLPLYFFGMFIVWCVVASTWAVNPDATRSRFITFSLLFIFVWLTWELADNVRRQKAVMRAFVLGTSVIVLNMYLGYVGVNLVLAPEEARFGVEGTNLNELSGLCCIAILYAYYLVSRREKTGFELPNWFYWSFIIAAGIAIPLTGSRAGMLGGAIAAVAFLPMFRQAIRQSNWKTALMLVFCLAVVAVLIPKLVPKATLKRFTEGTQAQSFQSRANAWQKGITAWSRNPLLGVGPGSFKDATARTGERQMVAHNTFVSVLVETGVIGSVLYFSFWGIIVRRALLMPKGERLFWLAILASYLPMLMTGSEEYFKPFWLLGALLLCQTANQQPLPRRNRWMAPFVIPGQPRPPQAFRPLG